MFGSRFKYVKARTWDTENNPESFPEINDEAVAVPWLADRPSFGLCFSGGGTRSATATLGQLRALDALGWIDKARYIGANSGGTWTTTPYTFLPAQYDEQVFLGGYHPPSSLNDDILHPKDEDRHSMASVIHDSVTIDKIFAVRKGDEAYAHIVGKIFLDPFGLHDLGKFFCFHEGALSHILDGNSKANDRKHYLKKDDFYLARERRPFLILVGTMLAQQKAANPDELYLIEMTPLYVGVRRRFVFDTEVKGTKAKKVIGGGYVEPFGYDSFPPSEKIGDRWKVRLKGHWSDIGKDSPLNKRYRFTLSDAIGASSAAPLVTLTSKGIRNFVFPEFRHWATKDTADPNAFDAMNELQHGDGGDIDNLALMPLLARQIENILVFINTRCKFAHTGSGESVSEDEMTDDLISLFRKTNKLKHNVVFSQGQTNLSEICRAFKECRAQGKPLVHCQTYDVIENHRHDIRPYKSTICWVYLDRAQKWIDALPDDGQRLVQELKQGSGKFDEFPHYGTFLEKKARLIDLDRERVQALSNLAAWTVFEAAEYIKDGLRTAQLPIDGRPNGYT